MSIWDLMGFIVFLPAVLVPLVMTTLLHVMPLKESAFTGVFITLILALCLRATQTNYIGKIPP
ncbi:MAG: hypothetical protein FWH37_01350 [Candidatus Bathyarchaeota archaeon]|nr:hypothetical protein [Candidatus Termiticorpusculum sp.]